MGNHEIYLFCLIKPTQSDLAIFRAVKAKHGGKWPVHVKKVVETKPAKSPRFYPAEDIPKPFDRLRCDLSFEYLIASPQITSFCRTAGARA